MKGLKIQRFLSQPFFVAEQFSGISGKYVKLEDTIRGFKEIIEGKHDNLPEQKKAFEDAGFEILQADEAYRPIHFYDVGALVWFARIIQWEFPGFSVDSCFDRLLTLQETIDSEGNITGTIHRFLIVAKKPERM